MKKWMQSLVAAALLVSMVAVEAVTPMTAYATEAEDEDEEKVEAEVTEQEPTEEITKEQTAEEPTANVPKMLNNDPDPDPDPDSDPDPDPDPEPDQQLATPKLGEATAAASGTKITWSSVSNAGSYEILRKLSGGSWEVIGTATGTSYTDKSELSGGKTYYYTVRACAEDTTKYAASEYDTTGLKSVYLEIPKLKTIEAPASGTTVTWGSVTGAAGYAIYRKLSGDSYSLLDTTTSTSYTDKTSLKAGKTYYYTVRAYYGNVTTAKNNRYNAAYWSGYNDDGLKAVYLATPTLSSADANATGTKVSWKSVSSAKGYAVYRKVSGGSYNMIATTTSTSYLDKESLTNGKTYYYTVRAYYGDVTTAKNNRYDAAYWSGYNTSGLKAVYLSTPVLNSETCAAAGTQIKWKSVSKASGYAVYRKLSSGSWSLIATTTSTSYTDKANLKGGKTYYYTVRAYYGNVTTAKNNRYNAAYWSGYDSTGLKTVYLGIPSLSGANANATGTQVSWKSVSGAKGYAVYRKISGGSYNMIATTTNTSYLDKESLSAGKTYYYTVRAFVGDEATAKKNKYSSAYWGGYNTSGVKNVYLATPKLNSVKASSDNAKVTWSKVSSATGYAVFRKKGSSGSWSMIGTTTSTSYTDRTLLTANVTYYYTVRAYKGNVTTAKNNRYKAAYWSGYDSSGLEYVAPEVASAMNSKAQSYKSDTKYLIMVDTKNNRLGIYTGSKGNWTRKYLWVCTTGKSSTPTPTGQYKTQDKGRYYNGATYTCWYYTRWHNGYLFHSVLYNLGSSTSIRDGALGVNKSHGCVRLTKDHAKWIYDHIPRGTRVVTYK